MSKVWNYSTTPGQITGRMQCSACGKPIKAGQYRYRMGCAGYINQHRACSADDVRWLRMDQAAQKAADFEAERRAAFDEFVAKWGPVDDLVEAAQVPQQGEA